MLDTSGLYWEIDEDQQCCRSRAGGGDLEQVISSLVVVPCFEIHVQERQVTSVVLDWSMTQTRK